MFYKVWTATTKYIRSVIYNSKKPIELANFMVFVPDSSSRSEKRSLSSAVDYNAPKTK